MHSTTRLALPNIATFANRCSAMDNALEDLAIGLPTLKPKVFLQNKLDHLSALDRPFLLEEQEDTL